MREISVYIPDFNTIRIKDEGDENEDYIIINLTLENDVNNFTHHLSPFNKYKSFRILPLSNNNLKIKIRLRHNDKIDKDLEYIFMDPQDLSDLCGIITPLQYKLRIIESLVLFDD